MNNAGISQEESEIVKLLYASEGTYLTHNSSYEMFYNGKEAFDSIIQDLENAKETIYMEYFIWKSDKLGEKIKDILVKKAKEGVKIRLLFDGMGSFGKFQRNTGKKLLKSWSRI